MSEKEAFSIFKEYSISNYFRKYYSVLRTQDFDKDVFLIEIAKEKSLQETDK
ncbi:MAG: hypothetical protein LBC87_08545 [Fibromonadaceae bacterium]|nr:hypothetical protein [Fibromonadaceae bacterium]